MNKVILIGRLTADVETKEYGKGKDKGSFASFSLAVRRDKDTTDFIDCTAFGKTAEFLEEYAEKNYVHKDRIKEIIEKYGFSLFNGTLTIPANVLLDLLRR